MPTLPALAPYIVPRATLLQAQKPTAPLGISNN